jgi:hypothetical protein
MEVSDTLAQIVSGIVDPARREKTLALLTLETEVLKESRVTEPDSRMQKYLIPIAYRVFKRLNAPDLFSVEVSSTLTAQDWHRAHARWDTDDLNKLVGYHGIDIETEFCSIMAEEMTHQFDHTMQQRAWQVALRCNLNPEVTMTEALKSAHAVLGTRSKDASYWVVAPPEMKDRIGPLTRTESTGALFMYKRGTIEARDGLPAFAVYEDPFKPRTGMLVGVKEGSRAALSMEFGHMIKPRKLFGSTYGFQTQYRLTVADHTMAVAVNFDDRLRFTESEDDLCA